MEIKRDEENDRNNLIQSTLVSIGFGVGFAMHDDLMVGNWLSAVGRCCLLCHISPQKLKTSQAKYDSRLNVYACVVAWRMCIGLGSGRVCVFGVFDRR